MRTCARPSACDLCAGLSKTAENSKSPGVGSRKIAENSRKCPGSHHPKVNIGQIRAAVRTGMVTFEVAPSAGARPARAPPCVARQLRARLTRGSRVKASPTSRAGPIRAPRVSKGVGRPATRRASPRRGHGATVAIRTPSGRDHTVVFTPLLTTCGTAGAASSHSRTVRAIDTASRPTSASCLGRLSW